MALYHKAIITPTKAQVLASWVPSQPWCPNPDAPVEVIGAYRFDDPEGRVGMETHLVKSGDTVLHVPLTYRDEPLAGAEGSLIGEMNHSVLGTRWVYDGLGDDRYLLMLAAVAMTGQGEALGLVMNHGEWFIAPSNVRITGGGWTQERVSVDGFRPSADNETSVVYRNDRFEMTVHRHLTVGAQPEIGLTALWEGSTGCAVLVEVGELTSVA